MEGITIQYQGFQPTEFTRSYIADKLIDIHYNAPPGAVVRGIFTRKKKIFAARVHLTHAGREFFASARHRCMQVATRNLGAQVLRKLQRRKKLERRLRGAHGLGVA